MIDSTPFTEYFQICITLISQELLDLKATDKNRHWSLTHLTETGKITWMEVRILGPFLHSIYKPSQVKAKKGQNTKFYAWWHLCSHLSWIPKEKALCKLLKGKPETKFP